MRAAAAVRGGRGSQQGQVPAAAGGRHGSGRRPRRPRIATHARTCPRCKGEKQRPPSAAAEDRNVASRSERGAWSLQRPPSAAAEDRNTYSRH